MSLPLQFCNFVADAVDYGINSRINFPRKRFEFCNLVRRENRPNAIGDSSPLDRGSASSWTTRLAWVRIAVSFTGAV